jgi:hypothetical protein
VDNCLTVVDQRADIFVLVVGGRYGYAGTPSGKSVTNLEYVRARAKGVPVYAFVMRAILSVLDVWKKNPEGDFSGIVDSTKLFEFVSELRDKVWVFPFERAQDIAAILRDQLAYLFADGLELQRRVSAAGLPPSLRQLSGPALRLMMEKPLAWEGLLLTQVIDDEITAMADLKRDYDYGVSFGLGEAIEDFHLAAWTGQQVDQLMATAEGLKRLVDTAMNQAMAKPAEPERIVYAARRVGAAYRAVLEAGLRCRQALVDPEFQRLAELVASMGRTLLSDIEQFNSKLRRDIEDAVNQPPGEGKTITVDGHFVMTVPELKPVQEEIARVTEILRSRAET